MWTLLELEKDLKENRFQLYFRPLYDIESMKICGAETLVLHLGTDKTLEYPSELLSVLEEYDLAAVLDMWVLEKVCAMQREIWRKGFTLCPVYINLSAGTIYNPYHIYDIVLLQKSFQLPACSINFSIPVTNAFPNPHGLNKSFSFLQQKGINVMLNYMESDLTILNHFCEMEFEKIQIDYKLIKKNVGSGEDQIINYLNHAIVMKGVDTLSQYQYLKTIGGKYALGQFFGGKLTDLEFLNIITTAPASDLF